MGHGASAAALTWDGEAAVLGENGPWALAGRDAVRWLSPDWQGTNGDGPRDPWGAPAAPGADGRGVRLGYRGELEIGTDTWLRHRIYQPGSRAFLQPDPQPPLPGSATAANPYHYASNNTITLSDPLGLHSLTDRELKARRDAMDRNWGDHLADAARWAGENVPRQDLCDIAQHDARRFHRSRRASSPSLARLPRHGRRTGASSRRRRAWER